MTWRVHADFPGMLAGGMCALLLQALAARYLTKDRIFRMAIIPEGQTLAQAMPSGTDANAAQGTARGR